MMCDFGLFASLWSPSIGGGCSFVPTPSLDGSHLVAEVKFGCASGILGATVVMLLCVATLRCAVGLALSSLVGWCVWSGLASPHMVSLVLSMLSEFGASSFILYFVSVDGLEVCFVDGWFCCPASLRLAAGLTLTVLVGLCVWSGPACFQPFSLLAAIVLHGDVVVVKIYQVVFEGLVLCISAAWCSSDELLRMPVGLLPCVGSCILLLALQIRDRVAGPYKVKKLPGKWDFDAHLRSLFMFLPFQISGCAVAAILYVFGQNIRVCLAAAACGAFLLNCVLVLCFCSDKPGFLGEHDSEFSLGSTGTSAKVLARNLCHLPGDCGHVLGLRVIAAMFVAACLGVCGHVLGLRFAAIVCAARFGFWLLVGICWIFEGVLRGALLAAASKAPEAAAAAAAAPVHIEEQSGVCQEVSVFALQAKATARLDVPETSEKQGYGVELEETRKVKKSFPVFLRTLQGRHQVLSCCADMLVVDLYELVADSCHMHCDRFMLVHQSKIVERSGALREWGIERDSTLTLTLRMLGGSGIPGEWHCALCNRGGCWHTKAWCFRCGTSRAESEAILRGSAQGFALPGKGSAKGKGIGKGVGPQPQREQRYPGRPAPTSGPQFSHAPTFHAPRQNKRKQADSSSPQLNALPQVVEVLKMLGCSQDILDMVKSKVDEQTKAQHKVPGEKERMLHVLKMKLTKAKSHLAHLQSVEKKKEEEYAHARDLAIEQARYLVDIQNQHDQAFQRVMEGSVVDSATSEGPILEEISDDEAQFQAMSDDDPDLAPKEWTQHEKRAQPEESTGDALNPPKFPRFLPAKIECTDAERAQVQAWDINSVQAMHNWCQERLAAACQATPEG